MNIELTEKEFRRLLDMVYIGNWVLNSTRGDDRFEDYDVVESRIFSHCSDVGMKALVSEFLGISYPSEAFAAGGIHDAIADYENTVFFDILAEELAMRDMDYAPINQENLDELNNRMDEYIDEFEANGMENIHVDI